MSASAVTAANESSAPTPAAPSAADGSRFPVLLAGLWFGLATGILEVAVLGYLEFVAGSPVWVSGQVFWMAPLADAVLFLTVAAPLAVLGATRWRPRVPALVTGILTFLACASVLLMFGLHRGALGLLAAGVGVQTARLVQARPERFIRVMRRTLSWLVATVAIASLGTNGWWWLSERRSLAALPAAAAGAPNVILLILDTVRAKSLGLHGYAAPTSPQLDRLAERGVVFERAIAPSPWTLPSHASVFTGRWAHELSADWEVPLDETYPTLAEELTARGYATAGFVANIPYTSRRHGLARGFIHYEDWPVSAAQVVLSSSVGRAVSNTGALRRLTGYRDILNRKRATHINRDLLDWADAVDDRPFFAFANYYDAHEPYLPRQPWAGKFGPLADLDLAYFTIDAWLPGRHELGPREIQLEQNAYEASIAGLDDGLGALVEELDRRGLLSNTLLIITSDHGEQFGEHGKTNHGNTLYLPLLHVPLIMMFDGRLPAGKRIPDAVSLRDLAATVFDLLDAPSPLPGRSLAPRWEDTTGAQTQRTAPIFSNLTTYMNRPANSAYFHGDMASAIQGRHQLIAKADGNVELYDIIADPEQLHDLAGSAAHQDVRLELERELRVVTESADSRRSVVSGH